MSLTIQIRFLGGLSPSQQNIFQSAAERWMQIITEDLPRYRSSTGEIIQGVLITAEGVEIDRGGTNGRNVLGQARATELRSNGLPLRGLMEFDSFDLARLESQGDLESVIIHEMGHVLGIGGRFWTRDFVRRRFSFDNLVFMGLLAATEWGRLIGAEGPVPVPVANRGAAGSLGVHWREDTLLNELMTPSLNRGRNPLSRITVAALQDLGYTVDLSAADSFMLSQLLEIDGPESEFVTFCSCGSLPRPLIEPIVLPETAQVD